MGRGMERRVSGTVWRWRRSWSAKADRGSRRDRDPQQLDGWIGCERLPKDRAHCHRNGRRSSDRPAELDGRRRNSPNLSSSRGWGTGRGAEDLATRSPGSQSGPIPDACESVAEADDSRCPA
jgi:hypothetical protein